MWSCTICKVTWLWFRVWMLNMTPNFIRKHREFPFRKTWHTAQRVDIEQQNFFCKILVSVSQISKGWDAFERNNLKEKPWKLFPVLDTDIVFILKVQSDLETPARWRVYGCSLSGAPQTCVEYMEQYWVTEVSDYTADFAEWVTASGYKPRDRKIWAKNSEHGGGVAFSTLLNGISAKFSLTCFNLLAIIRTQISRERRKWAHAVTSGVINNRYQN